MTVDILQCTKEPMMVVSMAAGCCYGKDNYSEGRVQTCYRKGHMSVFEHVSATFKVSDVSRACTHQLVRHRVASYSQKSQRYSKFDDSYLSKDDWYVIPPDISNGNTQGFSEWEYKNQMRKAMTCYLAAIRNGAKPEDARFVLPEATKTDIVCTMNLREIYHFLDTRCSKKAQWEIREVAEDLLDSLKTIKIASYADAIQWRTLVGMWEEKMER